MEINGGQANKLTTLIQEMANDGFNMGKFNVSPDNVVTCGSRKQCIVQTRRQNRRYLSYMSGMLDIPDFEKFVCIDSREIKEFLTKNGDKKNFDTELIEFVSNKADVYGLYAKIKETGLQSEYCFFVEENGIFRVNENYFLFNIKDDKENPRVTKAGIDAAFGGNGYTCDYEYPLRNLYLKLRYRKFRDRKTVEAFEIMLLNQLMCYMFFTCHTENRYNGGYCDNQACGFVRVNYLDFYNRGHVVCKTLEMKKKNVNFAYRVLNIVSNDKLSDKQKNREIFEARLPWALSSYCVSAELNEINFICGFIFGDLGSCDSVYSMRKNGDDGIRISRVFKDSGDGYSSCTADYWDFRNEEEMNSGTPSSDNYNDYNNESYFCNTLTIVNFGLNDWLIGDHRSFLSWIKYNEYITKFIIALLIVLFMVILVLLIKTPKDSVKNT